MRAGLHGEFGTEAEFLGVDVGAFLNVAQGFEGEVEKISRAAGRIEDAEVVEAQQKTLVGGAGGFAFLALGAVAVSGGELGADFGPFGGEGFADQRFDQLGDGAGVGVVGAERGAGGGVEAAFEEGAEDGGVDGAPVHVGGGAVQGIEVGYGERRDVDVLEEAAVEPGDVVVAVVATFFLHGGEQFFDAAGGLVGVVAGVLEQVGEDAAGEQLFVFGEHAEEALDEKVGDFLAFFATLPHGGGELGELAGSLGGDGGSGSFGAQLFGVGEHPFEELACFRLDELLDADGARFVRVAGEGGVDDDAFAVADDEQRRVFKLQGVVGELLEGGAQVAAGFLVFPAEMAALPDVGPAVARAGFLGAALETVVVRIAWLGDAEQVAEVVEMCLCPGAFGELVVFPEGDEMFGRHGGECGGQAGSIGMRMELGNAGGVASCLLLAIWLCPHQSRRKHFMEHVACQSQKPRCTTNW